MRWYISNELYEKLFREQAGVCAICDRPETRTRNGRVLKLSVDHCHTTKRVRGLLCMKCNVALGLFGDVAEFIQRAVKYVMKDRSGANLVCERAPIGSEKFRRDISIRMKGNKNGRPWTPARREKYEKTIGQRK